MFSVVERLCLETISQKRCAVLLLKLDTAFVADVVSIQGTYWKELQPIMFDLFCDSSRRVIRITGSISIDQHNMICKHNAIFEEKKVPKLHAYMGYFPLPYARTALNLPLVVIWW